ncbi:MAG: recombinase family protein [Anaerolineales bacterium]|nr:recombinase family protein [Anaerolineales bacterium]
METRPYRTVGYRRVSSREQLDGHSLEAQEVHISNFVEAQGWSLVQIYTDAGISAKKGSRRPALEQLLRDAKDGLFDVVVVDKIDRFYRHLGGLLTTLEQLHSSGVSFASVQEKLDFTTPWGKLMLTVLGMLAEIYLDNLRQETKKGQHQRARKGLWLGGVPFGYCRGLCAECYDPNGKEYCPNYGGKNQGDGKNLIAHPIENQVVKMVFDWYVSGIYSDSKIAEMLNQTTLQLNDGSEVPLRQKGRKGYTPPGPFGRDTIRDMIHRLAYTGKLPYQGMDEAGHHRKRCPPKEVFEGNHPALIGQELFDQVQNVRSLGFRNPKQKNGKTCRVFPLTGILRCGYCGGRMRGESSYNRRVYGDGRRIERKVICQQKQIGADILEQQAIEFLRDVVEHSNGKEELNVLQKQIKAAEDRLERARELYLAGEINRLNYNEERSRLESLEKDLHYNTIGATMTSLGVIRSGIAEWNDLSQIEQKRLLRLAVEAAWVRENAVVAVQPSIAFLSLLSGENGNMGNIGIRTRG